MLVDPSGVLARILALVAAGAVCLTAAAPAAGAESLVPTGGTFTAPVHVAAPPGDGRRVMVVEQGGLVKVVRDGVTLDQPFLSLATNFTTGGERGLLSIAFSPDYESSRLLYAYYTDAEGDIRVDEFRRAADSRDRVEEGYRRAVIEVLHREAGNHNGGTVAFGPDGNLYLATGDGGNAYDQPVRDAREPRALLGKLLRIKPTAGGGYTIPADNPFVAPTDAGADEVWAYGLRNPFRFSFDRGTGDLFIGDVGQGAVEEVNRLPSATGGAGRGANLGWDDCEGNFDSEPPPTATAPCTLTGDVRPELALLRGGGYCSVIGGVVVRDSAATALSGRYLYGDLCKPRLRSYVPGAPATDREELALGVVQPAGFGEDACGRVHVAELSGRVSRLEDVAVGCALRVPEPGDGGGGGGGGGAGGGGATPGPIPVRPVLAPLVDRLAPVLRLGGSRRQRLIPRGLLVRARCSEGCSLRALGSLNLRRDGRRIRLRQVLSNLAPNRTASLRLKVRRGSRALVQRSLARGRGVTATVRVRARDTKGNLRVARRSIRLTR